MAGRSIRSVSIVRDYSGLVANVGGSIPAKGISAQQGASALVVLPATCLAWPYAMGLGSSRSVRVSSGMQRRPKAARRQLREMDVGEVDGRG